MTNNPQSMGTEWQYNNGVVWVPVEVPIDIKLEDGVNWNQNLSKDATEDIAKLNSASDIYRATCKLTGEECLIPDEPELRKPMWDTQRGLIEMYDGARYLYPEYADYYTQRIEVLKMEINK